MGLRIIQFWTPHVLQYRQTPQSPDSCTSSHLQVGNLFLEGIDFRGGAAHTSHAGRAASDNEILPLTICPFQDGSPPVAAGWRHTKVGAPGRPGVLQGSKCCNTSYQPCSQHGFRKGCVVINGIREGVPLWEREMMNRMQSTQRAEQPPSMILGFSEHQL